MQPNFVNNPSNEVPLLSTWWLFSYSFVVLFFFSFVQKGDTGFLIACRTGALELVKFFLENYPSCTDHKNNKGDTGFLNACCNGNLELVNLFYDHNSSCVTQKNNDGDSGFLLACFFGHLKIVKFLLAKDPECLHYKNNYGDTGFLKASFYQHAVPVAKFLLKKYPDIVDQKNNNEEDCLEHAKQGQNMELVDWLNKGVKLGNIILQWCYEQRQ